MYLSESHGPAITRLAARSAMARTAALVLPETIDGITDASAIRRFSIPWTLSAASTTELPLVPILHVPTG